MKESEIANIPESFDESEDDLRVDFLEKIYETVLWSTDWTIETINASLVRGAFDLDPSFQRRNAWNRVQKSRLIESLIFNLPIPQIVLAESKRKRGEFIVVDGKQRLLTIQEFFSEKEGFKLSGLNNSNLNGLDSKNLEEKFPDYHSNLIVYTMRSVIIKNWPSDNFLYTIFYRLNTGSVPLSPQELRKSLKPGRFLNFVDDFASESKVIRNLIGKSEPDPRMRDLDLVLRYIAFKTNAANYSGNYKDFIDRICDIYNEGWENKVVDVKELLSKLEETISALSKVFGKERVFRRQGEKRMESRINRALYDVMTYYFSSVQPTAILERKSEIRKLVDNLISGNQSFINSTSFATNGLTETTTRFTIFGEKFLQIFPDSAVIPNFGRT